MKRSADARRHGFVGALLAACLAAGCGGKSEPASPGAPGGGRPGAAASASSAKGDSLYLAEPPVIVPDELGPDLDAMGIQKLYLPCATLGPGGKLAALPAPPSKPRKPVIAVVVGEPGVESQLNDEKGLDGVADSWSASIGKAVRDARGWADVEGVHLQIFIKPDQSASYAKVVKKVRKAVGMPLSVVVTPDVDPEVFKPLAGAADEALVFALGRRKESGDRAYTDFTEEKARKFPMPFRLLVAMGSYGYTGPEQAGTKTRLLDGEIDRLSEERTLDFDFGKLLSADPGVLYRFKTRPGMKSSLSADGGYAHFQFFPMSDVTKLVSEAARWPAPNLMGRVFLMGGVPKDGHLLGFAATKALLTGKPVDPVLSVQLRRAGGTRGSADIVLDVVNTGPSNSELTHFDNWMRVRVEGGVIVNAKLGDFDRFELTNDRGELRPFNRANVVKFYENFLAPEETNVIGPIRISGSSPKVFFSYKLALPGGRSLDGAEQSVTLAMPTAVPPAKKGKGTKS